MKSIIYFLLLASISISCKKKEEEINLAPSISYLSSNFLTVKEFKDSLKITIQYEDADGDIGDDSKTVNNIFLVDNRDQTKLNFHVSRISSSANAFKAKGALEIQVGKVFINTLGAISEQLSYKVYITDRGGNKSNEITTPTVTITR